MQTSHCWRNVSTYGEDFLRDNVSGDANYGKPQAVQHAAKIELKPNVPDTISVSLARLDEHDHYTLMYQVQNFGDVRAE
jgi:hypothetical protein